MFCSIDNGSTVFTILSWVILVKKTLTMALRWNKVGREIVRETPFAYMLLRTQKCSSIRPNIGLNALQVFDSPKTAYGPSHQELSPNDNNNYHPSTSSQIQHPINLPNPTNLPLPPHQLLPQNARIKHPLPQIHLRIPTTSPKPHLLQPTQSQQSRHSLRNPQWRHRKQQPRPRQPDRQTPQPPTRTHQCKRHGVLPLSARNIKPSNPIPSHRPDVS